MFHCLIASSIDKKKFGANLLIFQKDNLFFPSEKQFFWLKKIFGILKFHHSVTKCGSFFLYCVWNYRICFPSFFLQSSDSSLSAEKFSFYYFFVYILSCFSLLSGAPIHWTLPYWIYTLQFSLFFTFSFYLSFLLSWRFLWVYLSVSLLKFLLKSPYF